MSYSVSFQLCRKYLCKEVEVIIDRPLNSRHPQHAFIYETNYGYVPNTKAPDGEELDVYYLGTQQPLKSAKGKCIAIIHRLDDDDDKLVIVPNSLESITDEEILKAVHFQEKWYKHQIMRE